MEYLSGFGAEMRLGEPHDFNLVASGMLGVHFVTESKPKGGDKKKSKPKKTTPQSGKR